MPEYRRDPVRELVAGLTAGAATTLVMHPLDLIKVRLQVGEIQSAAGSWRLKSVRDAYRGLPINLVGNTVSWGVYFALYHDFRSRIGDGKSWYWASAFTAGIVTSVLTTPIWVLKTRFLATEAGQFGAYKSITQGFASMVREEGWRSLWRGMLPGMFGTIQASIQFSLYENMKSHLHLKENSASLSASQYLFLSASSKAIAATLLYPYQVVRARVQISRIPMSRGSIFKVIQNLYMKQGLRGFYSGLLPSLLRVVPSTSMTFLIYEKMNTP